MFSNPRKGQTIVIRDPNDTTTHKSRQQQAKKQARALRLSLPWQSEAMKVIDESIAHYKKTGNKNKLSIYLLKKKYSRNVLKKLVDKMGKNDN